MCKIASQKLEMLQDLTEKAKATNYKSNLVPNSRGGRVWSNEKGQLPQGNYREFDVNPRGPNGRDAERLVIDVDTGTAYYTNDHYQTFIKIESKQ